MTENKFIIALGIEYEGTQYCGWQKQSHSPSIQEPLEKALSFVANEVVEVVCSGRTDTGVHALEQVVSFKTSAIRDKRSWLLGVNSRLPGDIRVIWVQSQTENFHARFTAVARSYRYIILNSMVPSAIFNNKVCWHYNPLDEQRMLNAAQCLIGEHDFSSFRATGCQAKNPVRTIEYISLVRKDELLFLDIKANAFLYHMVRNIAGSLIAIGQGDYSKDWLIDTLEARDRNKAAKTSSASGLYFIRAFYPEHYNVPHLDRKPVLF